MTRRMACTQSSMSRWELAMSRSASGLAGTFSRSPAPPARQREQAYCRHPGRHGVPPPQGSLRPNTRWNERHLGWLFIPWGVRQSSLQNPFSSSCAFWFYICTSSYLAHLSLGPSWVSPLAFLVIFPYY